MKMDTIYVMEQGDYNKRRNALVTRDVKLISNAYTDIINEREACENIYSLSLDYDTPAIEIWVDGEYITYFDEKEKNTKRLIKYLSKLARIV